MWLNFISVIALITRRNHLAYLFADLFIVCPHLPLECKLHTYIGIVCFVYCCILPVCQVTVTMHPLMNFPAIFLLIISPPFFSFLKLSLNLLPMSTPIHKDKNEVYTITLEEPRANPVTSPTPSSHYCSDFLLPNPFPWFSAWPRWVLAGGVPRKEDSH